MRLTFILFTFSKSALTREHRAEARGLQQDARVTRPTDAKRITARRCASMLALSQQLNTPLCSALLGAAGIIRDILVL
jgi:hypothetical protein